MRSGRGLLEYCAVNSSEGGKGGEEKNGIGGRKWTRT